MVPEWGGEFGGEWCEYQGLKNEIKVQSATAHSFLNKRPQLFALQCGGDRSHGYLTAPSVDPRARVAPGEGQAELVGGSAVEVGLEDRVKAGRLAHEVLVLCTPRGGGSLTLNRQRAQSTTNKALLSDRQAKSTHALWTTLWATLWTPHIPSFTFARKEATAWSSAGPSGTVPAAMRSASASTARRVDGSTRSASTRWYLNGRPPIKEQPKRAAKKSGQGPNS